MRGGPPTPPSVRIAYSASRLVKSGERPEALSEPGVLARCRSALPMSGTEDRLHYLPLPFGGPVGAAHLSGFRRTRPCVAAFFPTDFSSTVPSADCPSAIAAVAGDPLRGVVFFCVPLAGLVMRLRQPLHAEALVSRCASFSGLSSRRAWGSPGVFPGCFRCVTVESTGLSCCLIEEAGNWGCHVCCLLTPQSSSPVLADGASVLPPTLFVRPTFLSPASSRPPHGRNLCLRLPFMLPITGLGLLVDCTWPTSYA